jgi:hypothetical protein
MRILLFTASFLLIMCCGTKQKSVRTVIDQEKKSQTTCPDDGTCSFEILNNKSLLLKYDTTNQLYPEIVDAENIVFKFEYKRNEIANVEDGGYQELMFLELNPKDITQKIEDTSLQKVKLLFARLCFCRGQTGYYKVRKGSLNITSLNNDSYKLELNFKIDEVPQIIKSISETFSYKKAP